MRILIVNLTSMTSHKESYSQVSIALISTRDEMAQAELDRRAQALDNHQDDQAQMEQAPAVKEHRLARRRWMRHIITTTVLVLALLFVLAVGLVLVFSSHRTFMVLTLVATLILTAISCALCAILAKLTCLSMFAN